MSDDPRPPTLVEQLLEAVLVGRRKRDGDEALIREVMRIQALNAELVAALTPFRDLFAGIAGPASVSVSFKVSDVAPYYIAARAVLHKAKEGAACATSASTH